MNIPPLDYQGSQQDSIRRDLQRISENLASYTQMDFTNPRHRRNSSDALELIVMKLMKLQATLAIELYRTQDDVGPEPEDLDG